MKSSNILVLPYIIGLLNITNLIYLLSNNSVNIFFYEISHPLLTSTIGYYKLGIKYTKSHFYL